MGFATGGAFAFTSSTYAHYFVPLAPYAALLGAPAAAHLVRVPRLVVALACLGVAALLAAAIETGGLQPLFETDRFSAIRPIIQLVDASTSPTTLVLSNRPEFWYLARRPPALPYFWDDSRSVAAPFVEKRLGRHGVAVLYPSIRRWDYPPGVLAYLNARYDAERLGSGIVWMGRAGAS
jgi:hypothetical protein